MLRIVYICFFFQYTKLFPTSECHFSRMLRVCVAYICDHDDDAAGCKCMFGQFASKCGVGCDDAHDQPLLGRVAHIMGPEMSSAQYIYI